MYGETMTPEQEAKRSEKYEELHRRLKPINDKLDESDRLELDGALWEIAREIATA